MGDAWQSRPTLLSSYVPGHPHSPRPVAGKAACWESDTLGRAPDPHERQKALWLKLPPSVTDPGQFTSRRVWPGPRGLRQPLGSIPPLPRRALLTAQLRQLEECGLKARVSPLGVGDQRDKQDVLGGEEGQVVGGRVGATQPVEGAEGVRVTESTKNPGVPNPGPIHKRPRVGSLQSPSLHK